MNIGFRKYSEEINNNTNIFSLEKYKEIVDSFADKINVIQAASELFLPQTVIDSVYKDIKEVEAMVIRCMTGTAKKSVNIDTGQITYFDKVISLEELKSLCLTLTIRDFDDRVKGNYNLTEPSDLQQALFYVIDKIIAMSDGKGEGIWDEFITYFDNE